MKPLGRIMKKILLVPLFLFALACGSVSGPQEAASVVGITAPDGFAVSCIVNFARRAPHLCFYTTQPTPTALTSDGVCHTLDVNVAYGIPTSSNLMEMQASFAAGLLRVYSNNTCAGSFYNLNSGTTLVPLTAAQLYYICTGCSASVIPVAYYD
jgi:hypothetical protein